MQGNPIVLDGLVPSDSDLPHRCPMCEAEPEEYEHAEDEMLDAAQDSNVQRARFAILSVRASRTEGER